MPKNLVPLDRSLRLGAGLFLLATPLLDLPTFPYSLFGIVPIATALAGFCPVYRLLGIGKAASRPKASAPHGIGPAASARA